jgi:hypothetical protein
VILAADWMTVSSSFTISLDVVDERLDLMVGPVLDWM